MKILFLSHFFPPTDTSGAENYAFSIAKALVDEGHQVHVLCAGTWDTGENYWNGHTDEIYAGIQVRRLHLCWHKAPDPNRYLYDNPAIAKHLRDWLNEIRPDIVHVISCYTLSASVMQVCEEADLPVAVTLVDFWFLCPSLHLLRSDGSLCDGQTTPWDCLKCMLYQAKAYRWPAKFLRDRAIQPFLTAVSESTTVNQLRGLRGMALNMRERKQVMAEQLRRADIILAPSHFIGSIHSAVVDNLPMRLQPHGHDLDWLASYESRSPDGQLHFCYMGQIVHDKGVHVLVEAFLRLHAGPGVALDLWGSLENNSAYVEHIRELVARSNKIHLNGRFPRSQLADVLSQADVIIVPSVWYENHPLVIQEAFAAKIPVITSNLGGMAEFVKHGINGLLFERGNVNNLAQQMQRVIDEPRLLDRLRVGIPPVKTMEQEVDEIIAVYQQLHRQKCHHQSVRE
jgi:glycosyltransferase involved in cell wall biosynthesis